MTHTYRSADYRGRTMPRTTLAIVHYRNRSFLCAVLFLTPVDSDVAIDQFITMTDQYFERAYNSAGSAGTYGSWFSMPLTVDSPSSVRLFQ